MAEITDRLGRLSPEKQALLQRILREKTASLPEPQSLRRREDLGPAPLSFAQQRLWFLGQLEPDNTAYNMSDALRLRGALDLRALQRSLREVVRRHESLRTTFAMSGDEPVQCVSGDLSPRLPQIDLRGLPGVRRTAELRRLVGQHSAEPFDLACGPLLRVTAARLDEREHALLFATHHIVSDGWSMGLLVEEVSALYHAFSRGEPSPLAELPVQYADYAVWQRGWLTGEVLERQIAYWREQLAGAPPLLELQTDHPRAWPPGGRRGNRGVAANELPGRVSEALRALCRQEGTTLFMALLAAWKLLLVRHSGQEDVSVGTSVAGRNRLELERLVGFFVNTLVLRTDFSGRPSFRQLLGRVRETTLGAYAHQDVPFERLVEELEVERSLRHSPLFQVMFALENEGGGSLRLAGLEVESLHAGSDVAKFDLRLSMHDAGGSLSSVLEYRTDLFEHRTIERMLEHFARALGEIASDPDRPFHDYPLLAETERRQVVVDWNATAVRYPAACVHDLVRVQAERTPDAVAVVCEEESLTYAQLERRANQLAHSLRRVGVGPEVRVGICLDRTPDLVMALLGVLKAGGAYVPLDPGFPEERLARVMADSGARVLLTRERLRGSLPETAAAVLCTDREETAREPDTPPESEVAPESLAYVIYTSGSTGTPKGVAVEHRQLVNYVLAVRERLQLDDTASHAMVSTPAADLGNTVLFPSLCSGGRLHLVPQELAMDGRALAEYFRRHRIDCLKIVPSHLAALLAAAGSEACLPRRHLILGGEASRTEWVQQLHLRSPGCAIVNHYGPTETTVGALTHRAERCAEPPAPGATVPLGGPLPNVRAYVLDPWGGVAPVGSPGELYIGGAGVARGYLGRPELTAERFLPEPFGAEPGGRMYRSGDRVRWTAGGVLEFLGRMDEQVKVRGYRIEPAEIEATLIRHRAVREAVVAVREDIPGDMRLVAYVVAPEGEQAPSASDLRLHVGASLPEYMIPSAFVALEAIPLTRNGKVDRRSLPAPTWEAEAYVAPRTPAEELLAGIWAEVLRVERVGVRESFFALGGHSLLATRVISRVRDAFGAEVPLRALFEAPTVEGLAGRVEEARRSGAGVRMPPIVRADRCGPLPLSFAQQRLWFLDQLHPGSSAYNMPDAVRVRGALDVTILGCALGAVAARHEVLRTTFQVVEGGAIQVVAPAATVHVPVVELGGLAAQDREQELGRLVGEEAARPFDLAAGPLLRTAVVRLEEEEWVVLFTIHHIVSDGWSMGVLVEEVSTLYQAYARGIEPGLRELPVQYADYAVWQREWLTGEVLEEQLAYWRERLEGAPPLLELPTDRPRPAALGAQGGACGFALGAETTRALRALSRREGATLFMTLLAAWQLLLSRYAGQEDVSVGTPIAGRTRTELEGLIGFFVNTLVLRADLSGDPCFRELLAQVREATLGAHQHQHLPFERLVEELAVERSLNATPLFQVMFVLQNNERNDLSLGEARVEPLGRGAATAKFDLVLGLGEAGEEISGALIYRTELFDAGTVERMLGQLERVLEEFAAKPGMRISEVPLLAEAERRQVVEAWNATGAEYPWEACVHELFREQAARTPDAVALTYPGGELSYAGLNAGANRLAHFLRRHGVGPDVRVGVCLERGPELLVGLLGILKAGGAYVPLDPGYPRARLAYMLRDCAVPVLLTRASLVERLPETEALRVRLDADRERIAGESEHDPAVELHPEHLAYVIYTSGSTGTPKGVAMPHRPLVNLLAWQQKHWTGPARATTAQFATISFDASFHEIFSTWCTGGRLVLVGEEERHDPGRLLELLEREAVERLFLPCVALQHVAEWGQAHGTMPSRLREVQTAGEQLRVTEPIRRWLGALGAPLHNHYGPSETHVVTTHALTGSPEEWPLLPGIGGPIANTRCYVLDERSSPVPVRVPGELYVGGDSLARGYLERPDVTAERFLPDPFSALGERLYRTGDRVRWLEDGTLEFLGRMDAQVKVRGYRIEPGEVEAVLERHPQVQEAVVVVREDAPGEKRLVAYVVAAEGEAAPPVAELRAHLSGRLPEYMVPGAFVALEALPLTPSGKVDRRALPAPEGTAGTGEAYVGPRSPAEEVLAGIWAEVLRVERVGVRENFFAQGGHSLLATRVISRVRDAFGTEVPLRALFEAPTVEGLAERIEAQRRAGAGVQVPPLVRVDREGPLPLSFAQQRLWFLDQLQPGSSAYNMPFTLRMQGVLEMGVLRRALRVLVERHDTLRTTFATRGGEPVQVIAPAAAVPVPEVDLAGLPAEVIEREVARLAAEEAARPFDLAAGPLLRTTVARLAQEEWAVLFTMHHIVSDGWSMGVLVEEVSTLYEAYARGSEPELRELPVQYADYAVWQREWLSGEVLEEELAYWRERLEGAPPLLELPTDRPRPVLASGRGSRRSFRFPEGTAQGLRALSRREGATLFMTLLAGWQTLLSRYSGQEDVVVGTPIAGRTRTELEGLIGFFVNTLVLRADLSGDPTFRDLLAQVREVTLGAYQHQDVPFERLVEELQPERSLQHTPLFQVTFALQNLEQGWPGAGPAGAESAGGGDEVVKFDLSLTAITDGERISGALPYSVELFDDGTIERMEGHLLALLEEIAEQPELRISGIGWLREAERRQLLEEWNATRAAYSRERCVHELFSEQAARTTDAVAVAFQGETLTYAELERRANRLAHYLRRRGVGPEVRVGLCLERSPEMVVALLGVLKAGGTYVPLDPSYPPERLAYMLADSGARLLLTQERLRGSLPETAAEAVCVDLEETAPGRDTPPESGVGPENLAYVIYTSGSTGRPKGVMIHQRALTSFAAAAVGPYGIVPSDRVLQFASLSFDASAEEIYATLLRGATLVLRTEEMLSSPATFFARCAEWGVTVLDLPTAYWHELVAELVYGSARVPDSVRLVIIGGERALPERVADWRRCVGDSVRLVNGYGPTEATVIATVADLDGWTQPTVLPGRPLPAVTIGRPVPNGRVYVLDADLRLLPPGVRGELFIGGAGVARGYLGRPELTAERFVPDPFSLEPGARLYRSGDVVRWRGEGELEYLGRVDERQVKVRGFRLEMGEIEHTLRTCPGVRDAVTVAREDAPGERRLVAYVIALDGEHAPSASELRAHVGARLPEYMIPSAFVALEALPLTPSGKVDYRALPAPTWEAEAYVAPRDLAEELLSGIWGEVLRLERVGVRENFFALGGHSLLATRVVSRVRDAFGTEVPLRALFEAPTVEGLAERIEAQRRAGAGVQVPPLVRVDREGPLPLSFAQQRLWFLDQLQPGSSAYNMPDAVRVRGALDLAVLGRALSTVVARHEVLRTTFRVVDGDAVQVVAPAAPVHVPVVELDDLAAQQREEELGRLVGEEAVRPFDLAAGPLLRTTVARLAQEEWAVLFTMHHIVSDGWSMGVLVEEVSTLYEAYARGSEPELRELPVQYADYAVWQREWLSGEVLEEELAYWRERLEGAPPLLELPTDRLPPAVLSGRGAAFGFLLGAETTRALRALSRREGATLFMTLLAAWQLLLSRYSGQEDVVVGTPIAGRTRTELEGLIGFFVNTLVLRADLSGDPTFRDLLAQAREVTLGAHQHQDVPFEKLVEELAVERSLNATPLFQVMFVLQNNEQGDLSLGETRLEALGGGGSAVKFDLSLGISEEAEQLVGGLAYRAELWEPSTMERLLEHYRALLEQVVSRPERRISDVDLLSRAERRQVLEEWNATGAGYPRERCIHELFSEQVARTPDAVAVVFREESLTYAELEGRANRLAHRLRGLGVGPEVRVGVCLARSLEIVVALLGVLKAGGAYVPLDPGYPEERLALMLRDSGARVVLTQARLRGLLPEATAEVVCLDREGNSPEPQPAPESGVGEQNLAYVIYTSGSTGAPKGVEVEHRSVSVLLHYLRDVVRPEDRASVLGSTSISFDVSVGEIFGTLCWGGRLVLVEDVLELPNAPEAVRLVVTVPSAAAELLLAAGIPAGVRAFNLAGEALPAELARRLYALAGVERVLNLYGPTEDTVYSTCSEVEPGAQRATIGRPVAGTRAYVLDAGGRPVPPGVPGELYLAGAGTARGYLGRPELTAERFVPDPCGGEAGGRMYRTGDRARWLASGELEYLGRIDQQVKLRGFRIELGEVEHVLRAHAGVRSAVAAVREDAAGDRRLVAYVVAPEGEQAPSASELRAHAGASLPEYMIPSAFVALEAIPLTRSGKVDHRSLPAPAWEGEAYVASRTPAEELLAGIWAEVLRVERVGVRESFFALGGHSLLATRVVSRVRDAFGVEVPLRALFEAPTVEGLAERIEAERQAGAGVRVPPLVRADRSGPLPLSFAQQRLWFLDQLQPGGSAYNMPYTLRVAGPFDGPVLARALRALAERHETLRTTFHVADGEPVQVIAPAAPVQVPVVDLGALAGRAREREAARLAEEEAVRPFDLAAGPLLRTAAVRLEEEEWAVLFTIHHIVSDGWSMGVLVEEASTLFDAYARGIEPRLQELPVQYADYAVWQREWLTGEVLEEQLAYWRERLEGAPPLLELPMAAMRPGVQTYRGASHSLKLSPPLAREIRVLGRNEGATLFMTLLAAFDVLLARYSGQLDVVVGTPIANRTRSETEGLIGLFLNTLALRTDLSGDPTFRELLARVREVALGAYAHQDVPFEHLLAELNPPRSLSHSPVFQVMFNLLSYEDEHAGERAGAPSGGMDATGRAVAKFDLELYGAEGPDGIGLTLVYNPDLFEAERMCELLGHLETLLEAVVAGPGRRISELPLLSEAERRVRSVHGSRKHVDHAFREFAREEIEQTIPGRFERQARLHAERVAIRTRRHTLTYAALDRASDRVARTLLSMEPGGGGRIAILFEHDAPMVVGMLGALKAGRTYVPLDPLYPRERVAFILEDSDASAVLTNAANLALARELAGDRLPVIDIDAVDPDGTGMASSDTAPRQPLSPEAPAYVLYTSGSTGQPKGVVQSHRNVLHHIRVYTNNLHICADDTLTLLSSYTFDAAVMDVYGALLNGAALCPFNWREDAARGLAEWIREERITLYHSTPTVYRSLVGTLGEEATFPDVRLVVLGGEEVQRRDVELYRKYFPRECILVNGLGPTESTVTLQYFLDHETPLERTSVSVGYPVEDTEVLLMNAAGEQVAVHGIGEIVIRSPHVALGYWQRPEQTEAAFPPGPHGGARRIYRTGDLGRRLPDWGIEHVGRWDFQVKIRGHRVEVGEIESRLRAVGPIREAVVTARDLGTGELGLVAYLVPAGDAELPEPGTLRALLAEHLPAYMIPSAFVPLPELPLTPTGKVDRQALPAPERAAPAREAFAAPRTPVEEVLSAIWEEVLQVDRVGIHHDFFDLGGHSLLATRIVSRVRQALRQELPLRALFENPTVAELAAVIDAAGPEPPTSTPPIVSRSRAEQMLERIGELSDAEVEKLLGDLGSAEVDL